LTGSASRADRRIGHDEAEMVELLEQLDEVGRGLRPRHVVLSDDRIHDGISGARPVEQVPYEGGRTLEIEDTVDVGSVIG
jgi:hypothetical protein